MSPTFNLLNDGTNTHIGFLLQGGGEGGGKDGDFMSEAKDWAGELISGQTGTGRILVRKLGNPSPSTDHSS